MHKHTSKTIPVAISGFNLRDLVSKYFAIHRQCAVALFEGELGLSCDMFSVLLSLFLYIYITTIINPIIKNPIIYFIDFGCVFGGVLVFFFL